MKTKTESKQQFLLNIRQHSLVEYTKTEIQLGDIIRLLSKSSSGLILSDIAEQLNLSVPTATKLVKVLVDDGLVLKGTLKVSENGRPPANFTLNADKFHIIGVEILSKFLNVSIWKNDVEMVHQKIDRNFNLIDDPSCLEYVVQRIKELIKDSQVPYDDILGIGIGMIESVRKADSLPNEFFDALNKSIESQLSKALGLPVLLDNDTRTIAVAEQVLGKANGINSALVVKVSRTLGLGIIINGQVVTGHSGYSGKLRHTQFRKGDLLCYCGKKGCLGTLIGGDALKRKMTEAIMHGEQSIYFDSVDMNDSDYHRILDASLLGDELSLALLQEQGVILGEALGNLINLLNPRILIIGGEFAMLNEIIVDAVKLGLRKTGLKENIEDCKVEISTLGRYLSSRAGVCMFLHVHDLLHS